MIICNKNNLRITILALLFSGSAYANWELAYFNSQHQPNPENAGGGYKKCFYKTITGYEFSFVTKDALCPAQVQVNPETAQVKTN